MAARVLGGVLLAACLLLMPACGGDGESGPGPAPAPEEGYTIRPEALWRTGVLRHDAQGNPLEWMLPSCRRVTPLVLEGSRLLDIDGYTLPLGLAVHPGGRHLFLTTAGRGAKTLLVIEIESGRIVHTLPSSSYFLGLAFRQPHGDEVYVSGGGREVIETYAFDDETGVLTRREDRDMPLRGFAAGLAVVPGRDVLLAVSQVTGEISVFDLASTRRIGVAHTGRNPYTVAVRPDGLEAYVSSERDAQVNVFGIADPARIVRTADLPTEKNPEALLVNREGTRLYVANADEDSLTVIAIGDGEPRVLETVDLRESTPTPEYGSSPNALAFSPDTQRLYVAQARLHKLAVIDVRTGAHLGDIPTGAYPTAVVLHAEEGEGGTATETLFVANGKGIGKPWEARIGGVPGNLSILPVPADEDLAGLTELVEANNAFPGRLFDLHPGEWRHPIPRERGGPTPIKHVFLVIRENKTYDTLLGAYQPPQGTAEGVPRLVMDEYERLLPNLYKLAERFAICDNYYSNAEASNQGHELLTGATVNTYVEKLVFADGRLVPIELEMVLNPVTWPKKDFIFQNALRSGVTFRDYGEAVGAGKDLLLFNEEYVHASAIDPPWYHMGSKDEDKIKSRIQEWESERFSGPNFPQLIVMLLPNDHTYGSEPGKPTHKSMVADNDLATGLFVDWLSKSPYWEESVAFITEDDPQQGEDHLDPHRTLMLVVSPWARRGHVSHVRYNEAHVYATIGYLLGMPPLTLFDEIAQPMYDLFDFEMDTEPFDHAPKEYPWEYNPPGTRLSERTENMYFAEPDEAEGLPELIREIEIEERAARSLGRQATERAIRLWRTLSSAWRPGPVLEPGAAASASPTEVLEAMVGLALQEEGDAERFGSFLDSGHAELAATYRQRREYLHAVALAADPVELLSRLFRELEPRPVAEAVEGDTAWVDVVYRDGVPARLRFVREAGGWRYDFEQFIGSAVRILGDTCVIKRGYEALGALEGLER